VLEYAIQEDRILLTLDADFANVLRFPSENTPGLVRLRVDPPSEKAISEILTQALLLLKNVDLRGRLAIVDSRKIRIRPRKARAG
jgi:predicted nuclease of predicted toxin-antitoxin system